MERERKRYSNLDLGGLDEDSIVGDAVKDGLEQLEETASCYRELSYATNSGRGLPEEFREEYRNLRLYRELFDL